jgi:hypothetical protein
MQRSFPHAPESVVRQADRIVHKPYISARGLLQLRYPAMRTKSYAIASSLSIIMAPREGRCRLASVLASRLPNDTTRRVSAVEGTYVNRDTF